MTLPPRTWILVADAGRARIFAAEGPRSAWIALDAEVHPQSRLRTHDLVTDRPGRSFQSGTTARAAMEPHSDPHDVEDRRFADALAERLLAGQRERAFESLLVVAPPRFLGQLRAALDPAVADRVWASIDADLTHVADGELPARIARHLE